MVALIDEIAPNVCQCRKENENRTRQYLTIVPLPPPSIVNFPPSQSNSQGSYSVTRYFISHRITPVLFYEPQVLALTPFFDDALETPPINTAAYMPGSVALGQLGQHLLPQYFEDTLNMKPMYSNESGYITVLYPQLFRLSAGPAWGGSDELPLETFDRKFPSIEGRQPKYMTSLAFHAVFT